MFLLLLIVMTDIEERLSQLFPSISLKLKDQAIHHRPRPRPRRRHHHHPCSRCRLIAEHRCRKRWGQEFRQR